MVNKIISIILILAGLGLIYFGYHESQSITSELNKVVDDHPTHEVLAFYIGGGIAVFAAIFMFFR